MDIVEILHQCDLFNALKAAGFRRLTTIARLCSFRKGQMIFRENDPCPGVYVVGAGEVRVFKTGAGGREQVLHIVGPGGTFAEVAAIGGFAVPASAEALKKTTCVLLPFEKFRAALAEDHEMCLDMMASLGLWVRRLVSLVEDVTLRDAAGRMARLLLESSPDDDGIVTWPGLKRHVASHLNLTSEAFSRTLRRMVETGLVEEVDRSRVRLLEPKKLRQIAVGTLPSSPANERKTGERQPRRTKKKREE